MTRVYYKEAVGAFVVFDMTRSDTFAAVDKWKADLDSKVLLPDGRSIPTVLIGNKCDEQSSEAMFTEDKAMEAICKEKGFCGYFPASAKENINVEEAANYLVQKIVENDRWSSMDRLNLDRDRIDGSDLFRQNMGLTNGDKKCQC